MHNRHGPPHLIGPIGAGLYGVCRRIRLSDLKKPSSTRPTVIPDKYSKCQNGLTCGGCVRKLEGRLADVPGVDGVQVQLEPGMARVQGTVEENTIRQAIQDAGFQPV